MSLPTSGCSLILDAVGRPVGVQQREELRREFRDVGEGNAEHVAGHRQRHPGRDLAHDVAAAVRREIIQQLLM